MKKAEDSPVVGTTEIEEDQPQDLLKVTSNLIILVIIYNWLYA